MIFLRKYTNSDSVIQLLLRMKEGVELHSILHKLPYSDTKAGYYLILSLGIPYRKHTSNNRNLESDIDNTSIDESRKPSEHLISSVTSGTDIDKATQILVGSTSIKYFQEILWHKDIKDTSLYTLVSNRNPVSIEIPLEKLMLNNGKNPNRNWKIANLVSL